MKHMRITLASLLLIAVAHAAQAATSPAELDKALLPYLQTHCLCCNNGEKPEGEFRVDKLSKNVGTENNPRWLKVMAPIPRQNQLG